MRALITALFHKDALDILRKYLDVKYISWVESKKVLTEKELINIINQEDIDILIVEIENIDENVINNTNLKLIGICRNDPKRNINLDAANKMKIPVIYTPGRNANAVAELTIAIMLAVLRKIVFADRLLKSGKVKIESIEDFINIYEKLRGYELFGKKVGIIGLGKIGYKVAEKLKSFNVNILVYDPYVTDEKIKSIGGERVDLDTLLQESDIITIHVVPTEETIGLIGKNEINKMKPTAFLINLANPIVIDEDALFNALKEKRIAGAGLDVFEDEPVESTNRFLTLDNVVVTPHIGGNTFETIKVQSLMITEDILRFLKGEKLKFLINPQIIEEKS